MKTIKYFNKATISYSFPGYYYRFLIFFYKWDFIVSLPD